jgi:hypothetical protein
MLVIGIDIIDIGEDELFNSKVAPAEELLAENSTYDGPSIAIRDNQRLRIAPDGFIFFYSG